VELLEVNHLRGPAAAEGKSGNDAERKDYFRAGGSDAVGAEVRGIFAGMHPGGHDAGEIVGTGEESEDLLDGNGNPLFEAKFVGLGQGGIVVSRAGLWRYSEWYPGLKRWANIGRRYAALDVRRRKTNRRHYWRFEVPRGIRPRPPFAKSGRRVGHPGYGFRDRVEDVYKVKRWGTRQVFADGKTINYTKTTIDNKGNVTNEGQIPGTNGVKAWPSIVNLDCRTL
jgi:hypothetical protein